MPYAMRDVDPLDAAFEAAEGDPLDEAFEAEAGGWDHDDGFDDFDDFDAKE